MKTVKNDKRKGKNKPKDKKAFQFRRDSVWRPEPISELRIEGGAGVLPPEESGPLDTPPSSQISRFDARRLARPLRENIRVSVELHGVDTPIQIVKIDGVAVVVYGKNRVRAARRANRVRARDGRPLITVPATTLHDRRPGALQASVVRENNIRVEDSLIDRIEKLQALLGEGLDLDTCAAEFGKEKSTLEEWLQFWDRAAEDVKAATEDERITASTAIEISKVGDAARQRAALEKILCGKSKQDRSARAARALARGDRDDPWATDRKSQRLLLAHLTKATPGDHESPTSTAYWRGVEECLRLVTRSGATNPELVRVLTEARKKPGGST